MNPLDSLLLASWTRLAAHLQRDRADARAEALRRAFRRGSPHLSRPVRPWCLAIRASDTRLRVHACVPKYAEARHEPHEIVLFSDSLPALCGPVHLPWPGIDWTRAAALLGRSTTSIDRWVRRGILRCKRYPSRSVGKSGPDVPHVWSPRPLDPNAEDLRPPHPAWGTLWQHMASMVPPDLEFRLLRTPVFHADPRGSRSEEGRPRGWLFTCPGLPTPSLREGAGGGFPSIISHPSSSSLPTIAHTLEHDPDDDPDLPPLTITCGRLVRRLYIPLPVWTVPDALGLPDPLSLTLPFTPSLKEGAGGRIPSSPSPDTSTPHTPTPLPTLPALLPPPFQPACHVCHRILNVNLATRHGWNEFIFHISGGLLYGHEVPRPDDIPAKKQTRPWGRHRTLLAEKHDDILAALAAGRSVTSIARDLGIPQSTLHDHVQRLQGKDPRARRRKPPATRAPAANTQKRAS